MDTANLYCLNCRQGVNPKIRPPASAYIVGAAVYFVTPGLLTSLGIPVDALLGFWAFLVPAIMAGVVIGAEGIIFPQRSCPICKTEDLDKMRPEDEPFEPSFAKNGRSERVAAHRFRSARR